MPIKTKHIVAGTLIGLGFFGTAFGYWQYQRLKELGVKFLGLRIKALGLAKINFDLRLLIANPTKVELTILSQKSRVFINNIFITEISSQKAQTILANESSPLEVNIDLSPAQISQARITAADLMKALDIPIVVDLKLKVKLWKLPPFNIPYVYRTNLRELLASPEEKPTPGTKQ